MASAGENAANMAVEENKNASAEQNANRKEGAKTGITQQAIQGQVFEVDAQTDYNLSLEECHTAQRHMSTLIEVCGGMIEAGLAVNGAIVRVAKRFGQLKLFTTPPKVLGFRFTRGFELLVSHCDQKELCLGEIYNLSLRHINYCPLQLYMDMRVAMIKEMILTIKGVFEESWNDGHTETWTKLLDWFTWNIIENYASSGMKAISLRDSWVHIRVLQEEDDSGGFGDALIFQLSVVAQEIFGLVVTERLALAKIFNRMFGTLVHAMGDPQKFTEEFFVLSSRHGRYGVQEHLFPLFQQSIMVTLRSLIPQVWNDTLEDAWSWFYLFCQDNMVRNFRDITTHQSYIETSREAVLDLDAAQLGADIHVKFLNVYPAAASLFQKTLRMLITTKIMGTLMAVIADPTGTLEDVRAVGVRHTKYGISERYLLPFGAMLWEIVATMLPGMWSDDHSQAWSFYLDFIASVMTRAIDTGTTLADNAFLKNSSELCLDAISQAPRCARAWWLLAAPVSGQTVSYFLWALQDMKFKLAECILDEVLTFRADCLKYYCGKDELFVAHPDLVQLLCDTNALMLLLLFDGLMWESQKIRGRKKRVNYYLKQLYGDPSDPRFEDSHNTALSSLVRLANNEIFRHPLVLTLMEIQWNAFGRFTFTAYMVPEILLLITFMMGFVVLDRHHFLTYGFMQGRDMGVFGIRVAAVVIAVFAVFGCIQCVHIYEDYRLGRVVNIKFYISRQVTALKNALLGAGNQANAKGEEETENNKNDEEENADGEGSASGSGSSGSESESGDDKDVTDGKKKHHHRHGKSKKKGVTYKELLGTKNLQELLGSNLARTDEAADDYDFALNVADFFTHGANLLKLLQNILLVVVMIFDQEAGVYPAADPHRREYQSIIISFVAVMLWISRLDICEFSIEMLKLRQTVQFSALHVSLTTFCLALCTFLFSGAITLAEPVAGYMTEKQMDALGIVHRRLAGVNADGSMAYGGFGQTLDEIFVNLFTNCGGIFTMRQREFSTHMLMFYIIFACYIALVLIRVLVGGTVAICLHTFGQRSEFAAIRRGQTLVALEAKRSVTSRKATFDAFGFDDPLEFDEDDLGPAGGIQIDRLSTDPIMNHGRKIGDRIVRYSCKCDDNLPWPVAAVQHDLVEEALERFEAMMEKFRRDFKVWHRLMLMKKADGTGQLQSLSISDQEQADQGSEGSDE